MGVATLRRRLVMSVVAVAALFVAVAGLVTGGGRAQGHHPAGPARIGDMLRGQFRAARESLRSTAIFGPLIDRLDPPMVVGKLVAMPPKAGS